MGYGGQQERGTVVLYLKRLLYNIISYFYRYAACGLQHGQVIFPAIMQTEYTVNTIYIICRVVLPSIHGDKHRKHCSVVLHQRDKHSKEIGVSLLTRPVVATDMQFVCDGIVHFRKPQAQGKRGYIFIDSSCVHKKMISNSYTCNKINFKFTSRCLHARRFEI